MLDMTLPSLAPLEWPIQHPSAIAYLMLLFLLPMALGGVIMLIGLVPAWRRSVEKPESTTEVARSDS